MTSNAFAAPGVELHVAHLTYGAQEVFRDLHLQLAGARWTCVLGRSGSGKSSLLRALAQLLAPQHCHMTVRCSDGAPLAGRIAYMAQEDLLLPWLSVLDNVTLGFRLRDGSHGGAGVRARARELLARVGLGDRAAAAPATLSGGMRQRVALARTLMEDRPLVLMDEPFSALDAITRFELQALAAELLRERTVLLITHDPLEALRLGDLIYTLQGRPARPGPPLHPAGRGPRAVTDPELLAMQAQLLRQLGAAGVAA